MNVYFSDNHPVPLPERHSFPDDKYKQLRARLLDSPVARDVDLIPATAATIDQLAMAHDSGYIEDVETGTLTSESVRRIGFPWSRELFVRAVHSVGATISACRAAVTRGIGINLGGGTHHAAMATGAGFCVFNDVVVAARVVQSENLAQRIVIVDCDVHQGDGTAELVQSDESVFSFSIHGANNFPFRKKESDLDIALPDGTDDIDYLDALESGLAEALERSSAGLAIYLAGADPFEDDRYGKLSLTKEGLATRDRLVLGMCRARGLPVAVTMAGGYARNIEDIVDINMQTIAIAAEILNS